MNMLYVGCNKNGSLNAAKNTVIGRYLTSITECSVSNKPSKLLAA